jgi:CheY-like chemotaxis protein
MSKKILLAEDSVTMQRVVLMTFAGEDVELEVTSSVDEALELYGESEPDLVIADLSMEGKNGYDLCKAVKAAGGQPVLILHGSAAPYDEAKGKDAGADGEITKPFETAALIDKVNALLSVDQAVEADTADASDATPLSKVEALEAPLGSDTVPSESEIALAADSVAAPQPEPELESFPPAKEPAASVTKEAVTKEAAGKDIVIVIDAEPPPATGAEPLPSFDVKDLPAVPAGLFSAHRASHLLGVTMV